MTLSSRTSLALLVVGLATVLMPCAIHAQTGGGGNTCVFVFGTINGRTVTTPSVMVVVPPTNVALGPTRDIRRGHDDHNGRRGNGAAVNRSKYEYASVAAPSSLGVDGAWHQDRRQSNYQEGKRGSRA